MLLKCHFVENQREEEKKNPEKKKKLWGVKWSRKSESLSVIEAQFELKILSFGEFGVEKHI